MQNSDLLKLCPEYDDNMVRNGYYYPDTILKKGAIVMNDDIMTVDEVAEYLKVSKKSIYRLVKSGKLPAKKVLNKWRFSRDRVKEWICGEKQEENKDEESSSTIHTRPSAIPEHPYKLR